MSQREPSDEDLLSGFGSCAQDRGVGEAGSTPRSVSSARQRWMKASTVWDMICRNVQFTSYKGLARNTMGGWVLGFVMALGLMMLWTVASKCYVQTDRCLYSAWINFALYLVMSSLFYSMEFLWHAVFHPATLDFNAFILFDHSLAFHIALVVSLVEFVAEWWWYPHLKAFGLVSFVGLLAVAFGQLLRTAAMFTAGSNFTHLVSTEKQDGHVLVTRGVYALSRHPSYAGWFWWSLGTQLLLLNPICTIGFSFASFSFFRERIPFEEENLLEFFGAEYNEYCQKVGIGIPFLQQKIDEDIANERKQA